MSMDCNQVQELISAYADGELDGQRRAAADRHLADCSAIRSARLDSISSLKTAMGDVTLLYNVPGTLQNCSDCE